MANSGSRVFGGGGQWLVSVFIFLCSFLYLVPVGATLPQIGNTKVPEPEAEIPAIPLHHTSWGSKDGAPSIVIGMAQTTDGWLWLATFTGLYRFDGVKFEKYTPRVGKLASPGIVTVFALPTGELWIGYRSGEAGLLKDGALRNYGAAEGLPIPSTLEHFQRDSSNRIWAISSGKLHLFRNDRWERFSAGIEDPNMVLHSIFVDSRDRLWAGTVEWAFVLEPGTKEFKKMPTKLDLSGYLTETPDGEIWSNGARNDSLQQVDSPRSLSPLGMFKPDSFSYSRHMLFDREGTRWLLRRDGVQRSYTANGQKIVQRLTPAQGLSGYIPLSVLEDKEGNIWVGTNSGLDRFRQTKLKKAALPPSYVGEGRAMAAGGEGSVWTDGFFIPNSSAIPIPVSSMPSNNVAELTCLYRDSDGIIWAGGFKGISYIDRGKFYNLDMPPDSNYYPVIAIAKEADGALWISLNGKGVFVRRNGEWTKSVQFPEAASRSAMAITATESGQLLFGYSPDRIALREKGQLRLFDKRDGLHLGSILSIHSYGSDIWVGGGSGIAHFDGKRFASMKGVGEDIFAGVSGIVTSKTGQLWLNGSEGISVIEHDEWSHAIKDPAYHVKFVRYNYLDGLVGT
ncbi:two-component regulator propeller domain-containing protein, partial [Undibacterium sp.]|uniref:ligand-binding sensor domain-containing protein n=1 Tax=Undibacterium sp. TaxID=1914977 RepID=UPI00374C9722